jgi:hypothetical protein
MSKTIREVHRQVGPVPAVTHVYDRSQGKIYTTEMHAHLRTVRRDMAAGKMMIPKVRSKITVTKKQT